MSSTYSKFGDIIIKDFLGTPEASDIAALETQLQTKLPESYKAFLQVANGGNLDGYYIDVDHPDMKIPRSFSLLYGTKPRLEGSPFGMFAHEIELSREAAQLPPQVLPIARDNSGCELYLDLTDYEISGEDRVVAFIHGIPDIEDQPEANAWVTVALHFEDFLKALQTDEEYYIEVLQETLDKPNPEKQTAMIDFLDQALPDWRTQESFAAFKDLQGTQRH
ncbi:MAG: SMI1/KNR4 family protein [Hyphomicrobiaceae bacterium]|nr:SMI1/KNR4 family protein [Hyphomicrobiaceae bacterium]